MAATIEMLCGDPRSGRRRLLVTAVAVLACLPAAASDAAPIPTRIVHASGRIVPIPASVSHEEGDMVDRRLVPDLRWIAARFPIFVTDGYSGPLPGGAHVGCNDCHTRNSDHYNGLAVDIVPLAGTTRCDAAWRPITRLAHWAEPTQSHPRPPFRWVGYDGDTGHGCGNHLHLSWEHAAAPMFQLAEWVEVFPVSARQVGSPPAPAGPRGGAQPEAAPPPAPPEGGTPPQATTTAGRPAANGPQGGISTVQSGGIGAGD